MENCWKHRNVNQLKTIWSFGIFFAWAVILFRWKFVQFSNRSLERFYFGCISIETPLVFFAVGSLGFFGWFFTSILFSFKVHLLSVNLLLPLPLLNLFFGGICSISLMGEIVTMVSTKMCLCLKDSVLHVFTMKCLFPRCLQVSNRLCRLFFLISYDFWFKNDK